MLSYILSRLIQGIFVIFLVSVVTFGVLQLSPGDPVNIIVGEAQVTEAQIEAIRHKWGLDKPWYIQYFDWLGNMATGQFGESLGRPGVDVRTVLFDAAQVTLKLNAIAFALAIAIAIPAGIIAGVKRYSLFDYLSMMGATLGVALPNFWIALMLIILFAVKLEWLPPFGTSSWKGYILPVAVLATEQVAVLARLTRGTMVDTLSQDYVTTARAKGLSETTVVNRHVLRNALLPIVSIIGYRLSFLLSGTIVVEFVFAIGGIGRLFVDAAYRLDYQVIQAVVLLFSVLVVVMNLVTDLIYGYIDPRIRIR